MKKILFLAGMLWSAIASAQFVPGQILTAAELNSQFALYAKLTGASFSGGLSATGITATPISGSTGSFTNLSASGTVSFPAGTITPGSLTAQAANTMLANVTGSSSSPSAVSLPSCSTSSSALLYTSGTGLSCNTSVNAATLGGNSSSFFAPINSPTFTGTVTIPSGASISGYLTTASAAATYAPLVSPALTGTPTAPTTSGSTNTTQIATTAMVNSAVTGGGLAGSFTTIAASGAITPSQTAGIVGTTTNNNANAGSVGEYVSNSASGTSVTTGVIVNATSVSLTAGDWDVSGVARFNGTSVIATAFVSGINTTSATLPSFGLNGYAQQGSFGNSAAVTGGFAVVAPTTRISLSATTTVYLIAEAFFSSGSATVDGLIRARRVR